MCEPTYDRLGYVEGFGDLGLGLSGVQERKNRFDFAWGLTDGAPAAIILGGEGVKVGYVIRRDELKVGQRASLRSAVRAP